MFGLKSRPILVIFNAKDQNPHPIFIIPSQNPHLYFDQLGQNPYPCPTYPCQCQAPGGRWGRGGDFDPVAQNIGGDFYSAL